MRKRIIVLFFLFLFIAGAAWTVTSNPAFLMDATVLQTSLKQKRITIHNTLPVTVEVADTDASRVQGLSGREVLPDGHGLLFVFPQDQPVSIWMKDMKIPIDVLWINASGEIVWIYPDMQPESYPQTFGPAIPVRYVLEVPAGFVEINNIVVGDTVQI